MTEELHTMNIPEKMEILAPAGNPEALKAAVFAGADAVYLGGSLFSARANAVNFTNEELAETVSFARTRGVKVYLTVNTVMKDSELEDAMEFISFLCSIPVDGILVQDMGLFRLIKEKAPDIPLHCSTQMSIHTPAGAKLVAEMGADRVVLSRELSLEEIREIHNSAEVELEAFVHGALCMSVSGQCYFSAMLGSRSGNRGRCAQPCRLPFSTRDGAENVLSLKDMSFIKDIDELRKAGICSAKIEGRMKRPEYVAAAVSACRRAADGEEIPQELTDNLEAVFSRSGFTDGYLKGKLGPDMFGIRTKEDVTAGTSAVFGKLHELYKGEAGRVPVDMKFSLICGEEAVLTVSDNEGRTVTVKSDTAVEKANNRPLDEERLKSQLSKLGSTPYYAANISVTTDGISIMPMSAINDLRRRAAEELSELRSVKAPVVCDSYECVFENYTPKGKMKYRGVFASADQVPDNVYLLDWAYLPITESDEAFKNLFAQGVNVGAEIPREFFGAEDKVRAEMKRLMAIGVKTFLCGNLGAVALCKELGADIHGSYSLNITNTESIKTFENLGLKSAELSYELTLDEISAMGAEMERGIMVYGRQALMLVRNCPIGHGKCIGCEGTKFMTDRKGARFPVKCMKGKGIRSIEVLNSVPLSLSDRMHEVKNVDYGILRFTVESSVESFERLEDFIGHEKPRYDYTRGLFYRGVL